MRPLPHLLAAWIALAPTAVPAESIRVATYNIDLSQDAPGLMLQELQEGPEARARAAIAVIKAARPDVLVVQKLDHDLRGRTLDAFAARLAEGPEGIDYPHRFAAPVNAGVVSGLDLDGDGLVMGRGDALGWGKFPGHGGMAILSRLPIDADAARTFRNLPWRDLPGAVMPLREDGTPWLPEGAEALPLSSRSHWDVPVVLPGGARLHLLTAHPTPPLFDGPEGMNRLRNRDEILFFVRYLDGWAPRDDRGRTAAAPDGSLVVLGDFNLDPEDGQGDGAAIAALVAHPRLRDPRPASAGATEAARTQGGANALHSGPAAFDTADWRDDPGPGNLRVSYLLPSGDLDVTGAGVFWPAEGDPGAELLAEAPPHRLVWADIAVPAPEPALDQDRPGG